MAPRPALHAQISIIVVAIILLACAATGMLAGTFAHTLASGKSAATATSSLSGPVISGTPPGQSDATATPSLTATQTTPPAVNPMTGFTLRITLSSRSLAAGESLTVTVEATANGAPVAGLTCSLRAPTGGPPGLLATWPASVSTDANGRATWTLTAPAVAAGTYGIEAFAVGAKHYEFHRYVTVTLT